MLFLCCLRIANVQYKCTHVRRTFVTTQCVAGEIRVARIFIFFFLPNSLVNGALLFLCCLRIANVQHKCRHVRRTCVTTQWVDGENPHRADFNCFLLPSSLINGAMLFLCCLHIANVQYKYTHVRRTCVRTQWVVGENPRRADFYFVLLPSYMVNGTMLFLCCLRIANEQYKCTNVRRTCVTTRWVVGGNPRRMDFFSFCQAPWAMGPCCFGVVCALP